MGIGLNCRTGLVYAACNIMGDWRYSGGFDPKGHRADRCFLRGGGRKKLRFYADGELISILDYTMFRGAPST